jgi:hypothetical protein
MSEPRHISEIINAALVTNAVEIGIDERGQGAKGGDMGKKLTWKWLEPRLSAIKASWLEDAAQLRKGKIHDAKRGTAQLTEDELGRIGKALRFVCIDVCT